MVSMCTRVSESGESLKIIPSLEPHFADVAGCLCAMPELGAGRPDLWLSYL